VTMVTPEGKCPRTCRIVDGSVRSVMVRLSGSR
jgi:hypothetical protein